MYVANIKAHDTITSFYHVTHASMFLGVVILSVHLSVYHMRAL